jgi:starch-binding outer membrane protein, SusD/RagB family
MKIMKHYWMTTLVVLVSISSCDVSRLDTPSIALTELDYFKDRNDFEQALFHGYSKMTDWYWFRAQNFIHPMLFLPGDDITENQAFQTWEQFNNINADNDYVTYFYTSTFQMIQRVNVVIEKVDAANPTNFPDASFLPVVKGEALFLRALALFKLFNMYGTAPLVTERLTTSTMSQPKSSGTQLLDQAIQDLQTAEPLLPTMWDEPNRGRVTKNSANGLLLKALVFRGDYTNNAADYAAAVEAYNKITATLTDNYTDNFSGYTENNSESLFEFQASRAPGVDNVWLQNDGPWRGVEVMSAYWGFYTTVSNGQRDNLRGANWKVTEKFANLYGNDPRVDFFMEDNRNFTKYGHADLDVQSGTAGSLNNNRILRFAESKLLAAEAILLSNGNKVTAINLINEVRTRARNWANENDLSNAPENRNTAETNNDVIMGWIEDERAIELLGEEQVRWFDLKRWDKRGYKNLSNWGGGIEHFSTDLAGTFQFEYPKHLLLPIPQAEIDRNVAITDNNPGY